MKIMMIAVFFFLQNAVLAQNPKPKPKPVVNKPVAKAKTPKVIASIGGIVSGTYSVSFVKNLLDNDLVIKDENGKTYPINRCTFLYKRRMTYKDDDTGETKISWEYLGKELRNNEQLNKFWRSTIKEDLKKGEVLSFEKILANSEKGFLLQVKGITITVE